MSEYQSISLSQPTSPYKRHGGCNSSKWEKTETTNKKRSICQCSPKLSKAKWLILIAISAILLWQYRYEIFSQIVWPCQCFWYKSIYGSSYLFIHTTSQHVSKHSVLIPHHSNTTSQHDYQSIPKTEASVRFVCSSDTHFFHEYMDIPDGDVFIHSGDILLTDSKSYKKNKPLSIDKLYKFKNWLNKLPHRYKIIIAGNHDTSLDLLGKEKVKQILHNEDDDSIIYLENEEYILDIKHHKIKLYGSPCSIDEGHWYSSNKAFQLKSNELRKIWDKIPNDTDILMTHQHPDGFKSGKNGCEYLTETVENCQKCKYHLFGHHHAGYGVSFGHKGRFKNDDRETVVFMNAAAVTGTFMYGNYPIVFDYK